MPAANWETIVVRHENRIWKSFCRNFSEYFLISVFIPPRFGPTLSLDFQDGQYSNRVWYCHRGSRNAEEFGFNLDQSLLRSSSLHPYGLSSEIRLYQRRTPTWFVEARATFPPTAASQAKSSWNFGVLFSLFRQINSYLNGPVPKMLMDDHARLCTITLITKASWM